MEKQPQDSRFGIGINVPPGCYGTVCFLASVTLLIVGILKDVGNVYLAFLFIFCFSVMKSITGIDTKTALSQVGKSLEKFAKGIQKELPGTDDEEEK